MFHMSAASGNGLYNDCKTACQFHFMIETEVWKCYSYHSKMPPISYYLNTKC